MNNLSNLKGIVDAMAEVTSLDNKAAKTFNDLRKGAETATTICEIMNLRDGYYQILNWLFIDELCKGYYTSEDSHLSEMCLVGIVACNNELRSICYKYAEDKVQSELMHFMFGNNQLK